MHTLGGRVARSRGRGRMFCYGVRSGLYEKKWSGWKGLKL